MILSMLMIYIIWPHTSEGNESMLNVLVASEGQICKGMNDKTKSFSFYCLFCLNEQLSFREFVQLQHLRWSNFDEDSG